MPNVMKILNLLLFFACQEYQPKLEAYAEAGKHFVNFVSLKNELALFHFTFLKVSFSLYCFYLFLLYPFFPVSFYFFPFIVILRICFLRFATSALKFFIFYFCFLHSFYSTLKLFTYTVFCFISFNSPNHLFQSFIITASDL